MFIIMSHRVETPVFVEHDQNRALELVKWAEAKYKAPFFIADPTEPDNSFTLEMQLKQLKEELQEVEYNEPGDGMGQDAGFHQCWRLVQKAWKKVFDEEL